MPRKYTVSSCYVCGKPSKGKVCSPECSGKYQSALHAGKRVTLTCQHCGESFEVIPCRRNAKYCSSTCYGKAKTETSMVDRICNGCGTAFRVHLGKLKKSQRGKGAYCSSECWNRTQQERRKARRDSLLTRAWRDFVLERDGHRCRSCGATDKLHAHHVRAWATFPAGRFDPANGITLCKPCHVALHVKDVPAQLTIDIM